MTSLTPNWGKSDQIYISSTSRVLSRGLKTFPPLLKLMRLRFAMHFFLSVFFWNYTHGN